MQQLIIRQYSDSHTETSMIIPLQGHDDIINCFCCANANENRKTKICCKMEADFHFHHPHYLHHRCTSPETPTESACMFCKYIYIYNTAAVTRHHLPDSSNDCCIRLCLVSWTVAPCLNVKGADQKSSCLLTFDALYVCRVVCNKT